MGANAQTSVPTFTAGDVLTAANMNISARTGVPVFATTVTRDAAFGGTGEKTLAEGQMCYIETAPRRLQVYNGTAWIDYHVEWTTWSPTWTNVTVGNGTVNARYSQMGKTVFVQIQLIFGSTTSITGNAIFTLPVTASTAALQTSENAQGWAVLRDATVGNYYGWVNFRSSTTAAFEVGTTNATYLVKSDTSATSPFTWTTSDQMIADFFYEAA